jgi:hypothetical protein
MPSRIGGTGREEESRQGMTATEGDLNELLRERER